MIYVPCKPMDPMKFNALIWPEDAIYDKQREIIYSVEENDITISLEVV